MFTLSCIVEGDGEIEAVPNLIRRIALHIDSSATIKIPRAIRFPRTKLKSTSADSEIERVFHLAKTSVMTPGGILFLHDADDDCPADLGKRILKSATAICGDIPVAVVFAKHEYEAWFIAAAESLAGKRGLPTDLKPPPDPEQIRAAKGWISRNMPQNRPYSETLDQPAFSSMLDIDAALTAPSFSKLYRDIKKLLTSVS